jgi:hypothetical protein
VLPGKPQLVVDASAAHTGKRNGEVAIGAMKHGACLRVSGPCLRNIKDRQTRNMWLACRIQNGKPAVLTLLFMLLVRCFDRFEAAAAWLWPVRAVPAAWPAASSIAASVPAAQGPWSVSIPVPAPGLNRHRR